MLLDESHHLIPQLFFGILSGLGRITRTFEMEISAHLTEQFSRRFEVDVTQTDVISRHLIHASVLRQFGGHGKRQIAHFGNIKSSAVGKFGHN